MLKRNIKYILITIVMLLTIGCSAIAYVQKVKPVKSNLAAYDTAYVNVQAINGFIERSKGFNLTKSLFEKRFIAKLSQTKKFKHVIDGFPKKPEKGSLNINLIVEDAKFELGMFGVTSGNARLKVLAKITDENTGKTIGVIRSGAQTGSSGGIFIGDSNILITEVSDRLVNEISSYK